MTQPDRSDIVRSDVGDFDRLACNDDPQLRALFLAGPVTIYTVKALWYSDTPEARERLLAALDRPEQPVQLAALRTLTKWGDPRIKDHCLS